MWPHLLLDLSRSCRVTTNNYHGPPTQVWPFYHGYKYGNKTVLTDFATALAIPDQAGYHDGADTKLHVRRHAQEPNSQAGSCTWRRSLRGAHGINVHVRPAPFADRVGYTRCIPSTILFPVFLQLLLLPRDAVCTPSHSGERHATINWELRIIARPLTGISVEFEVSAPDCASDHSSDSCPGDHKKPNSH